MPDHLGLISVIAGTLVAMYAMTQKQKVTDSARRRRSTSRRARSLRTDEHCSIILQQADEIMFVADMIGIKYPERDWAWIQKLRLSHHSVNARQLELYCRESLDQMAYFRTRRITLPQQAPKTEKGEWRMKRQILRILAILMMAMTVSGCRPHSSKKASGTTTLPTSCQAAITWKTRR